MRLHEAAVSLLESWSAPDRPQEHLRLHFLKHLASHDDALQRTCRPGHLTASLLVVSADRQRVLLTLHEQHRRWLQTGGHCDPDDASLLHTATREGHEESGIAELFVHPTPVRLSRHDVAFCAPAGPTHHLDVQFVAVVGPEPMPTRSRGSDRLRWFGVGELPELTDDAVRSLVDAGLHQLAQAAPSKKPLARSRWG